MLPYTTTCCVPLRCIVLQRKASRGVALGCATQIAFHYIHSVQTNTFQCFWGGRGHRRGRCQNLIEATNADTKADSCHISRRVSDHVSMVTSLVTSGHVIVTSLVATLATSLVTTFVKPAVTSTTTSFLATPVMSCHVSRHPSSRVSGLFPLSRRACHHDSVALPATSFLATLVTSLVTHESSALAPRLLSHLCLRSNLVTSLLAR